MFYHTHIWILPFSWDMKIRCVKFLCILKLARLQMVSDTFANFDLFTHHILSHDLSKVYWINHWIAGHKSWMANAYWKRQTTYAKPNPATVSEYWVTCTISPTLVGRKPDWRVSDVCMEWCNLPHSPSLKSKLPFRKLVPTWSGDLSSKQTRSVLCSRLSMQKKEQTISINSFTC